MNRHLVRNSYLLTFVYLGKSYYCLFAFSVGKNSVSKKQSSGGSKTDQGSRINTTL